MLTDKNRSLNPFAFPPETNMRFLLFAFAALLLIIHTSHLFIADWIPRRTFGDFIGQLQVEFSDWGNSDDLHIEQQLSMVKYNLSFVLQELGILCIQVLIIFGLAFVFYRIHPSTLRWRKKLVNISEAIDPNFTTTVRLLSERADIAPVPKIALDKSTQLAVGQVFGFNKRYFLLLNDKMRLLLRRSPNQFNAVVLHELAHIANKDVRRTYFAQALWSVLLFLTITPLVVFVIFDSLRYIISINVRGGVDRPTLFLELFQQLFSAVLSVVATVGFSRAIRASLLRIREFYADWRASLWGAKSGLTSIFQGNASCEKIPKWTNLWLLHPSSKERLETLNDPAKLFRITMSITLITGYLFAVSLPVVIELCRIIFEVGLWLHRFIVLTLLHNSNSIGNIVFVALVYIFGILLVMFFTCVPLAFLAYCVAGTLSIQVQRDTVANLVMSKNFNITSLLSLFKPAMLFVIGYYIGFYTMPVNFLNPFYLHSYAQVSPLLLHHIIVKSLWMAALTLIVWIWLVHSRLLSKALLGSYTGKLAPKRRINLITTLSCFLLVLLLPLNFGIERFAYPPQLDKQYNEIHQILANLGIRLPNSLLSLLAVLIIAMLILTIIAYLVFFLITWLIAKIMVRLHKRSCPYCEQLIKHRMVLDRNCEHCGKELGSWLLIDDNRSLENTLGGQK